ncbi:MAG: hypothetical protein H0V51_20515 [Chloroflexi bacterium]|nr:hypothetical protein [Chloroflexota bacterium]
MRIVATFYRRVIIMVRPLEGTIPERSTRLPVVRELLCAEDLEVYRTFHPETAVDVGRFSCLRLGSWQHDWHTAWGEQPFRIVANDAPEEPLEASQRVMMDHS